MEKYNLRNLALATIGFFIGLYSIKELLKWEMVVWPKGAFSQLKKCANCPEFKDCGHEDCIKLPL